MAGRLRQRFGETGAHADPWVRDAAYDAVHEQQVRLRERQGVYGDDPVRTRRQSKGKGGWRRSV